jgi:hypothetical protein
MALIRSSFESDCGVSAESMRYLNDLIFPDHLFWRRIPVSGKSSLATNTMRHLSNEPVDKMPVFEPRAPFFALLVRIPSPP